VDAAISKGRVLDVPVLDKSPWVFELQVKQTVQLNGSVVLICKIRNILTDEKLAEVMKANINSPMPVNEAKPVVGWGGGTYFKVGDRLTV
jgi:flavin reductase (DIM6/NTAB) family NADH-FMN oxidoreductase RutF